MQRVAAIDVAKASGMICARVPHAAISGKRVTRVGQWKSASAGASRPSFERGSPRAHCSAGRPADLCQTVICGHEAGGHRVGATG